jgi:hypothetical protein
MTDLFSGNSRNYDNHELDTPASPTRAMALQHFQNLAGSILDYYGADGGDNTFNVDGIVFKVLEDPNDGYRSMLGTIDYTDQHTSIFFKKPISKVRIVIYDSEKDESEYSYNQGYRLVDVDDGHVWLEFGTHNYDDYYPYFIFRHMPKESS